MVAWNDDITIPIEIQDIVNDRISEYNTNPEILLDWDLASKIFLCHISTRKSKKLSLHPKTQMPKKPSIPINLMTDKFGKGIAIGKASITELRTFDEASHAHRDDYHLFFLQEIGTTPIEVDFQKLKIESSCVMYIHPSQVHRMTTFENVTLSFLAINNENLKPEYLSLLEDINPVKPLYLEKGILSIISESVTLSIKISEIKQEKLYHSLLKDSCNTLVALIASQYLAQTKPTGILSRFELITKAFKSTLEHDFMTVRRPVAYAQKLHISTHYLNECVKNTTGQSISSHIQQRIILEAKRLLYHSDKSIKEIAAELGYDDYPYFSRLFTKVAGMSPKVFKKKNSV